MSPKEGGTRKTREPGGESLPGFPAKMFVLEGPPTPSLPLRELGGGESDVPHTLLV